MPKGFDSKCLDLAQYFLQDGGTISPEDLAQIIQDAIEDNLNRPSPAISGVDDLRIQTRATSDRLKSLIGRQKALVQESSELIGRQSDLLGGIVARYPDAAPPASKPEPNAYEINARLHELGFSRVCSDDVDSDLPRQGDYWMRGDDETIAMYRFRGIDHVEFTRPVPDSRHLESETDINASILIEMVEEYVAKYPKPIKAGHA